MRKNEVTIIAPFVNEGEFFKYNSKNVLKWVKKDSKKLILTKERRIPIVICMSMSPAPRFYTLIECPTRMRYQNNILT